MARAHTKLAPVIPTPLPPPAQEAVRESAHLDDVLGPLEQDEMGSISRRISQPPARAHGQTTGRAPLPHMEADGAPLPAKKKAKKVSPRAVKPASAVAPVVVTQRRELLGLTLVSLGVLCVMALWSYRPGDGPWALARKSTQNWVGPVGAMLADGLIGVLGLGSHVMAGGLLLVGALCFVRRPPSPSRVQFLGGMLTLLCSAVISHLALKGTGVVPYAPGGLLGALCGDGLASLFSAPGTAVISGAGFAAGVVLCTDLSLTRLLKSMGGLLDGAAEVWREHAEVRRQKAQLRAAAQEEARAAVLALAAQEDAQEDAQRQERAEKRKHSARLKAVLALEREAAQAKESALENSADPALAITDPGPDDDPLPCPVVVTLPMVSMEPNPALGSESAPTAKALPQEPTAPTAAPTSEPRIVEFQPRAKVGEEKAAEKKDDKPRPFSGAFELPPLNLLDHKQEERLHLDREALNENAKLLVKTFKEFQVEGTVREIRPGPVVTTYEFTPAPGVRVNKVAALADDLAMALEAMSVRIVAPIPGKNAVGIEIPNNQRQGVFLKEIIGHPDFMRAKSKLTLALGKNIEGKPFMADLARMPHVLIAGTTGSGKSVSVNGMILSLLYKATPDDVRLLMIDPKMLELKLYDGIPHLLLPPVTDPKKAAMALRWAVEEMERRYQLLADFSVRDISTFNEKMAEFRTRAQRGVETQAQPGDTRIPVQTVDEVGALVEQETSGTHESDQKALERNGGAVPDHMPYIVVIVDEFADLMMVAGKDVETYVARLAQKARACGIHVMLATQRPSVDVITGVIKANFPTRMSFKVASVHDSKTIIEKVGANRLLGNGDMLMLPPGSSDLVRVHGGFVSEHEIVRVVNHWKAQGKPQYNEAILTPPENEEGQNTLNDEPYDALYDEAVEFVANTRKASISSLQRKLNVGYNRAAKMIERMQLDGLVGPSQGANKPLEVLVQPKGDG